MLMPKRTKHRRVHRGNRRGVASGGTNVRVYDVMSAGVLIGAIPPLLIYFFGGKYFVRGLTQGAIK